MAELTPEQVLGEANQEMVRSAQDHGPIDPDLPMAPGEPQGRTEFDGAREIIGEPSPITTSSDQESGTRWGPYETAYEVWIGYTEGEERG